MPHEPLHPINASLAAPSPPLCPLLPTFAHACLVAAPPTCVHTPAGILLQNGGYRSPRQPPVVGATYRPPWGWGARHLLALRSDCRLPSGTVCAPQNPPFAANQLHLSDLERRGRLDGQRTRPTSAGRRSHLSAAAAKREGHERKQPRLRAFARGCRPSLAPGSLAIGRRAHRAQGHTALPRGAAPTWLGVQSSQRGTAAEKGQ